MLGTDLFNYNDDVYLIVADCYKSTYIFFVWYYSMYTFARKVPMACASHVVVMTIKHLFSKQDVPHNVYSDNGQHFDCANYRKFTHTGDLNMSQLYTHYPQSNGFVERSVQAVKNILTKAR